MNPKERVAVLKRGCDRIWHINNIHCKETSLCPECNHQVYLIEITLAWVRDELEKVLKHPYYDADNYPRLREELKRFVREMLE